MRKLLIALVVLIAIFVAADRIAVAIAENQISSRVETAYGLPAKPQVAIGGFPFLTQAVAGSYRRVDVSAPSVQAGGFTLRQLRATFTGVRAPLSQVLGHGAASVTAARATGSAEVGFAELQARLPTGMKLSSDGRGLKVAGTLDIQGVRVPLTATVLLRVTSAGIEVTPTDLAVAPGVSIPAGSLASTLGFVIPVHSLPLHLTLTSVRVTPAGLLIGAAARDLHFAQA